MTSTYHVLEPEVAGTLGKRSVLNYSTVPPSVTALDYEFNIWPVDDLLEEAGSFVVTARLRASLEEFAGSGYHFDDMVVSRAADFDEAYPEAHFPAFFWMKVSGVAGADDAGLTKDQSLVVSDRLLAVLRKFDLSNCTIRKKPYTRIQR